MCPPPNNNNENAAEKNTFLNELRMQMNTSIPSTLGLLLYKIPWLISLHFVGNMGSEELAAAALASALCDVTGMSFAVGLSSAITTLTAQARGEILKLRNRKEVVISGYGSISKECNDDNIISPLLYLYRGIFIQLMFVVPVGLYWIQGISPLLVALGQDDILSSMTADYLRVLTPGLWSYSINWTLTAWLQALEMADVPAYAAFVGLMTHIPFNLLFIKVLGWGYLGVALGTVMFQIIQPLLICCYLYLTSHGRARVDQECTVDSSHGNDSQHSASFFSSSFCDIFSYKGILQYLALGLPGVAVVSEWWASNTAIFLGGRLTPAPDLALDGMTIYQSINTFCFMFPIGASVGGSTRVGNFLGMRDHRNAKRACYVSVLYAGSLAAVLAFLLYIVPNTFLPSLFSPDWGVQEETARVIPLLALYVFADGIQVAFNGVIKGCGRQCITVPIVLTAYWIVGVPLAYYFSFVRNGAEMYDCPHIFCGIEGLVAGMTAGTWVHMLLLAVTIVCGTDWEFEAEKSQQRLKLEQMKKPVNSMYSTENSSSIRSWMIESEHLLENVP